MNIEYGKMIKIQIQINDYNFKVEEHEKEKTIAVRYVQQALLWCLVVSGGVWWCLVDQTTRPQQTYFYAFMKLFLYLDGGFQRKCLVNRTLLVLTE